MKIAFLVSIFSFAKYTQKRTSIKLTNVCVCYINMWNKREPRENTTNQQLLNLNVFIVRLEKCFFAARIARKLLFSPAQTNL